MTNLKTLNIEDNPLIFPAEEIVKNGPDATLRFLIDILTQGEREVYEVKMLILGEGGVGKTTLWHKLQDIDYPVPQTLEKQPSTQGIEIKEGWEFEHLDHQGVPFLVNLWDFGGQPIQHMTHQFFLTRRSFYVLLADGRAGVANFSYWFKIINLLGCETNSEKPMPVLVILNKKGSTNVKLPYDPVDAQKAFPGLDLIRYELDFAKMDYNLKNLPGVIREILCKHISHLPLKIPSLWDDVRSELYQLRELKDHITLKEFENICKDHGIDNQQRVLDLSQLLHELGVILHHQDDVRLKNFIILNPEWAINAVYEILKHEKVRGNQGRFNQRLLSQIWDKAGYNSEEQSHMMSLMLKDSFEVCFHAEEGGKQIYIAPQLLPDKRPNFHWNPGPQALRYTYQYPFMPKGLIGRLIVRVNEKLKTYNQKKLVWEKGMCIEDESSEAIVVETEDKKTGGKVIQVEIIGPSAEDRRFFLRTIRNELGKIHQRSFPNLKFEEKIPCCCAQCLNSFSPVFYDLSDLNRRLMKEKLTIECSQSFEAVNVSSLLRGVFEEENRIFERPKKASLTTSPKRIFFSYSKHDKDKLDSLRKFLDPLKRQNKIALWDDRNLLPGEEWDKGIRNELEESDIILLMVSANFLATDYVWDVEIKRAMERHEVGSARVVPVILDYCVWEDLPFGKINGLPSKGKPVADYESESKAWTEVVKALKGIINTPGK